MGQTSPAAGRTTSWGIGQGWEHGPWMWWSHLNIQTDPRFWYKKVPSLSEGLQLLRVNCVGKGQRQHLRSPCSAGPARCS